ncbi:unnamed protein product [Vitrella brassicaformis CCMP3155]|uniref:Uncharacterized protein n=1 Tax=Vitrella brassicaformis (strain CCMP3155) TaxID=1169540 RepID=A0A0G4ESC8_VITBC|nr:unnamed protein product [Vitrella brassicaformis CCMP3155]|eukprot:CEM00586.1 unnamed protein product [Vitrella brassicaformis CCMP3155]
MLERAPKLKSLSTDRLRIDNDFASLPERCPDLTDIRWLELRRRWTDMTDLGKLKRALDPIWRRPNMQGVEKRLGLKVRQEILVPFASKVLHPLSHNALSPSAFLDWAASVKCTVEWRAREVTVDCSRDLVASPPAPTGPMAKMIKDISSTAHKVTLMCGGKPLHGSWASLMVFNSATKLMVAGVEKFRDFSSVPQWMAVKSHTGGNRHLPNIANLHVRDGQWVAHDDAPEEPNGVGALLGTLDRLTTLDVDTPPNVPTSPR